MAFNKNAAYLPCGISNRLENKFDMTLSGSPTRF